MKLILLQDVKNLGKTGEIVKVKNGYGRNYLLPTLKAEIANAKSELAFEGKKTQLLADRDKKLSLAAEIKESLVNVRVNLIRQAAEDGKLYRSVNARDILVELQKINPLLERDNIILEHPIKNLGEFTINISLSAELNENVILSISRKEKS